MQAEREREACVIVEARLQRHQGRKERSLECRFDALPPKCCDKKVVSFSFPSVLCIAFKCFPCPRVCCVMSWKLWKGNCQRSMKALEMGYIFFFF